MTAQAHFFDDLARDICAQAGRTPLLSAVEERLLIAQAQFGAKSADAAFRRLVLSHQRLVIGLTKKYHAAASRNKLQLSDLIQAGNMGLFDSIRKFDLSQSVRLCTFARKPVIWAIKDLVCQHNADITRVPIDVGRDMAKLRKVKYDLAQTGSTLSEQALAEKLGWQVPYLKTISELARPAVSIHTPIDEDGTELGSLFAAEDKNDTAGEGLDYARFKVLLRQALSKLDPRESTIVCAQFAKIIGQTGASHAELSARFNVSRTRIGQIYLAAKEELKADPELAELGLAFA